MGGLLYPARDYRRHQINFVWEKGHVVPGSPSAMWRKDCFGTWMKRSDYGDCSSPFGWEIDHIRPSFLLGPDDLNNMQPLNWRNNRSKGDRTFRDFTGPCSSPI
jgi:5-methylcytosine-specific restriction endonuclease McrA